jgi:hypothetical protein
VIGPNLSEWALKHRSFTVFLMIVVTAGRLAPYLRLGCLEQGRESPKASLARRYGHDPTANSNLTGQSNIVKPIACRLV